jgi:hypothetical protein
MFSFNIFKWYSISSTKYPALLLFMIGQLLYFLLVNQGQGFNFEEFIELSFVVNFVLRLINCENFLLVNL